MSTFQKKLSQNSENSQEEIDQSEEVEEESEESEEESEDDSEEESDVDFSGMELSQSMSKMQNTKRKSKMSRSKRNLIKKRLREMAVQKKQEQIPQDQEQIIKDKSQFDQKLSSLNEGDKVEENAKEEILQKKELEKELEENVGKQIGILDNINEEEEILVEKNQVETDQEEIEVRRKGLDLVQEESPKDEEQFQMDAGEEKIVKSDKEQIKEQYQEESQKKSELEEQISQQEDQESEKEKSDEEESREEEQITSSEITKKQELSQKLSNKDMSDKDDDSEEDQESEQESEQNEESEESENSKNSDLKQNKIIMQEKQSKINQPVKEKSDQDQSKSNEEDSQYQNDSQKSSSKDERKKDQDSEGNNDTSLIDEEEEDDAEEDEEEEEDEVDEESEPDDLSPDMDMIEDGSYLSEALLINTSELKDQVQKSKEDIEEEIIVYLKESQQRDLFIYFTFLLFLIQFLSACIAQFMNKDLYERASFSKWNFLFIFTVFLANFYLKIYMAFYGNQNHSKKEQNKIFLIDCLLIVVALYYGHIENFMFHRVLQLKHIHRCLFLYRFLMPFALIINMATYYFQSQKWNYNWYITIIPSQIFIAVFSFVILPLLQYIFYSNFVYQFVVFTIATLTNLYIVFSIKLFTSKKAHKYQERSFFTIFYEISVGMFFEFWYLLTQEDQEIAELEQEEINLDNIFKIGRLKDLIDVQLIINYEKSASKSFKLYRELFKLFANS